MQKIVIVISKFLKLYSKAKCTSLFTSAATNQRVFSKGGSREAQVRFPEYQEGTEQCFGFNKLHFTSLSILIPLPCPTIASLLLIHHHNPQAQSPQKSNVPSLPHKVSFPAIEIGSGVLSFRPSLRFPYLVFSIRSYLPLDFNRISSLRPTYRHPFGGPFTYSLLGESWDWL